MIRKYKWNSIFLKRNYKIKMSAAILNLCDSGKSIIIYKKVQFHFYNVLEKQFNKRCTHSRDNNFYNAHFHNSFIVDIVLKGKNNFHKKNIAWRT